MGIPQRHTRVVVCLFSPLSGERERFAGYFHLAAIGVLGDVGQLSAAQLPAFIIHSGIGSRRILAQNVVEQNQRLDDILPGRLSNISKTAHQSVDPLRSNWIFKESVSPRSDLLEQNQL